jgi:hypothetical protein
MPAMAITMDELVSNADVRAGFVAWQPGLEGLVEFCVEATTGTLGETMTLDELVEGFGPDGKYPIDWAALGVEHMIIAGQGFSEGGHAHADGIERRIVREIHAELRSVLEPYLEAYEFSTTVSNPTAGTIGIDDIDWSTVAAWNEAIVKDLAEGDSVKYWQNGEHLVIGEQQTPAWRMAIEAANGVDSPAGDNFTGWLTMTARGTGLSAGRMTVNGNCDQRALKDAVRAFSNKRIDFA